MKNQVDETLVCERDIDRMNNVVEQLIQNWSMMHDICSAKQISFFAIVQPNSITHKARRDHIEHLLYDDLIAHYKLFYQLLEEKLKILNHSWILDLTSVFDGYQNEFIFLDDCHMNRKGNQILTDRLCHLVHNY